MRNRFLLHFVNFVAILFLSSQGYAEDVTALVAGSIPEVGSFKGYAAAQISNLEKTVSGPTDTLLGLLAEVGMVESETLLEEIKSATLAYKQSKLSCGASADAAEIVCIESKSELAAGAKKIIDAAGPLMAAVSTAQKACSSTASTTSLAQQAMTLAKGACVAAKVTCDSTCAKADAELTAINSKVPNFIVQTQIKYNALYVAWCATAIPNPTCPELTVALKPAFDVYKAVVPKAFTADAVPAVKGTTTSLVLRCQGYTKDVVLFAANILSLLQANKSAAECAAKLGSGGGSATAKEYCTVPENATTSLCKCQKDSTAEGCLGHVATTENEKNTTDDKGKNIKPSGAGNQFAGEFDKVKPTAIDLGGLKSDSASTTDDKKTDPLSASGGGGSASNSSGGSSGGFGAAGAAGSKEAVAGDDKKKLGLGSFFGSGGGSSSGSGSGKIGTGSLGQKDMDAIQRQIASEKLRAEVSGASGKSNWEKVSERYLRNKATLLVGQ